MKTKLFLLATILFQMTVFSQLKEVAYSDGSQKLIGFAGKPAKSETSKSGVLILPAWMGVDAHAKETATDLAKLGYTTFVADIYGVGNMPTNSKEAGAKAGYYKTNIAEYHKRIQLALDELVKQGANPDKIVVMGYCFGGTGAIEAARSDMKFKGIVSFHGGLSRDEKRVITPISAKVLVLHGADDPYVPEADIKLFQNEMRTAKADWEMNYYANAVHSFTDKNAGTDNSKGAAYNELAEKRSWKAMLQFLKEVL